MAATKSGGVILASTSCAASGTQSATANLTTSYATSVTASITNGSSAPTAACTVTVNVSYDNSTWRQAAGGTAGLSASTAYTWRFPLEPSDMYVQVVFTGNTGQAVTVASEYMELTGL